MRSTLMICYRKLQRDRALGWHIVVGRAVRYLWELLSAPIHLRQVSQRGRHVRTLAAPRIDNQGHMVIGSNVLIRSINVPVELATSPGATLRIGDGARINYGVSIAATCSVEVGARVRIGPYVMIVDTDFHDAYERSARPAGAPISIGDDAWIGAKASVLKGVRIGRGAIVGVGAVVTRDVPAFAVVAGVPARQIGMLDSRRFVHEEVA
jgi:acetyltransferase-like isoleucine patch superfamily enzyme